MTIDILTYSIEKNMAKMLVMVDPIHELPISNAYSSFMKKRSIHDNFMHF
jgi:hypothetical protein